MPRKNTTNKDTGCDSDGFLEIPSATDWTALYATKAIPKGDDGQTSKEIRKAIGKSKAVVQSWLKEEIEAGRLVKGIGVRASETGARIRVPVYRPAK